MALNIKKAGQVFKQLVTLSKSMGNVRCITSSTNPNQDLKFKEKLQLEHPLYCTLIPGDGIGPELSASVKNVVSALKVPIIFEELHFSEVNPGSSVSVDKVAESIKQNQLAVIGPLSIIEPNASCEHEDIAMKLRRKLNLFVNVVQIKNQGYVATRHQGVDFVVIREQTEGEYTSKAHQTTKGTVEGLKIITEEKSYNIAKFAFDYAVINNRKKVTCVHKANIMKIADGLFLKCCEEVSKYYPQIEFQSMIVDNTCMQLVSRPQQFDVMVMPNLYGDIVANLGSGLIGGAGLVPGASYDGKGISVYEVGTRHSYNAAAGKDIANPAGMLYSICDLLNEHNLPSFGDKLKKSIDETLSDAKIKTKDLGGNASTTEFTKTIIERL